jgi:hypothetical protein
MITCLRKYKKSGEKSICTFLVAFKLSCYFVIVQGALLVTESGEYYEINTKSKFVFVGDHERTIILIFTR